MIHQPTPADVFQVFNKLIRRYKYLEKGFEEEIKKVCLFCEQHDGLAHCFASLKDLICMV